MRKEENENDNTALILRRCAVKRITILTFICSVFLLSCGSGDPDNPLIGKWIRIGDQYEGAIVKVEKIGDVYFAKIVKDKYIQEIIVCNFRSEKQFSVLMTKAK